MRDAVEDRVIDLAHEYWTDPVVREDLRRQAKSWDRLTLLMRYEAALALLRERTLQPDERTLHDTAEEVLVREDAK